MSNYYITLHNVDCLVPSVDPDADVVVIAAAEIAAYYATPLYPYVAGAVYSDKVCVAVVLRSGVSFRVAETPEEITSLIEKPARDEAARYMRLLDLQDAHSAEMEKIVAAAAKIAGLDLGGRNAK